MEIDTKIAIVILNYNTADDCRKCISLLKKQQGVEVGILVVDNASRPDQVERITTVCDDEQVTLIRNYENRGYSAGNNIGLRYATDKGYQYALIMNPDMEIRQPEYLRQMVKCISEDDKIAVIGSDILNVEGNHQNPLREIRYFEELLWPLELIIKSKRKGGMYVEDFTHSRYCEKLLGCCLMVRMSFAREMDFLDENTFLYCEEAILAKQVRKKGMKMYYLSDIQAFHNHVSVEKGDPVKRMGIFLRSRYYYLEMYSGYSRFPRKLLCYSRHLQLYLYRFFKKCSR